MDHNKILSSTRPKKKNILSTKTKFRCINVFIHELISLKFSKLLNYTYIKRYRLIELFILNNKYIYSLDGCLGVFIKADLSNDNILILLAEIENYMMHKWRLISIKWIGD